MTRTTTGSEHRHVVQRTAAHEVALRSSLAGVATGLAWTPAGGDILFIEATRVAGSGRLIPTGQLGDVMKESVQAGAPRSRHDG